VKHPEGSRPKAEPTLATYVDKVARLGGYLARSSDGLPGNLVIWRGLARLTDIVLGFQLGAQTVGNWKIHETLTTYAAERWRDRWCCQLKPVVRALRRLVRGEVHLPEQPLVPDILT
jgi:hypothetical protein